jgi:hypothetical protein
MTYDTVLCHNDATPFSAVLPVRGGARETAMRESWRVAGCLIGHAAACGSEKTGLFISPSTRYALALL